MDTKKSKEFWNMMQLAADKKAAVAMLKIILSQNKYPVSSSCGEHIDEVIEFLEK